MLTPLILALTSSLFSPAHAQSIDAEHQLYSKLFPFHIEFSAMTQIKPFGAKAGGPGGHAFIYLHGWCKDYSVPYPKVIPCSEAKFPPGLEHTGVGISVDNDFVNTNFVVVPGHRFFFTGLTDNPGVVTDEMREAIVEEAVRLRIFEGVIVKEELADRKLSPIEYQKQLARNAVGTDIAGQFGRHEWGVRFRSSQAAVKPLADFLTRVNAPYVAGLKEYTWDLLHDNCAMLSANALYEACVRKQIPTGLPLYKQIFNVGLPRNGLSTMQNLVHGGGRNAIARFFRPGRTGVEFQVIRSNEILWKNLQTFGVLPVGLGGISTDYKTFTGDKLYADDVKVKRMPHKILGANLFSDQVFDRPEFTDLKTGVYFWKQAVQSALEQSQSLPRSADLDIYQAWARRELAEADRVIGVLTSGPCFGSFHDRAANGETKK